MGAPHSNNIHIVTDFTFHHGQKKLAETCLVIYLSLNTTPPARIVLGLFD